MHAHSQPLAMQLDVHTWQFAFQTPQDWGRKSWLPCLSNPIVELRPLSRGEQKHFDSTGDAELVVDAVQIVLHRVFAYFEFTSDSAIAEAFDEPANYLFFPFGEQLRTMGIHKPGRGRTLQGFQKQFNLIVADPEPPFVHSLHTFGKHFQRLIATKQSASSPAKSFNDQVALGGIEHHDRSSVRNDGLQLFQNFKTLARGALQTFA